MEMDIDDLLQEFDDGHRPSGTRDINDLTQSWIAERTAPEILPFQTYLLERLMERVRQQVCF
jgi:GINS complex subunit 4